MNLAGHHGKGVFAKKYRRSCNQAKCPTDYESWAALESHRAMERFEAAGRIDLLKHVIVSPPHQLHDASIPDLRTWCYKYAKQAGVKGGICIFHPFRWRCLLCLKDDESCHCERPEGTWYWSPHFHLLCHAWVDHTAEISRKSGWVIVNLGLRKSAYRTVQYQLSHAGIHSPERMLPSAKPKILSITWFGSMGYRRLHVVREPFKDCCPECGRELVAMPKSVLWMWEPPPELADQDRCEGWWIDEASYARFIALHPWERQIEEPQPWPWWEDPPPNVPVEPTVDLTRFK